MTGVTNNDQIEFTPLIRVELKDFTPQSNHSNLITQGGPHERV